MLAHGSGCSSPKPGAPLLMPFQEAVITVEASVGMNIQILSQEAEKIQDPTVPFKDIP